MNELSDLCELLLAVFVVCMGLVAWYFIKESKDET